jgi:hypothetical protein
MEKLRFPGLQDAIGSVITGNPQKTAENLEHFFLKGRFGEFNYTCAKDNCGSARTRQLGLIELDNRCRWTNKTEVGRRNNRDVLRAIYGHGRPGLALPTPDKPLQFWFRRDLQVSIKPTAIFSEAGKVKMLWLQARKSQVFSTLHLQVIATLLRRLFAADDYAGAEIEIIDCRARKPGKWKYRADLLFRDDALPSLSQEEMNTFFQTLADAWDLVLAREEEILKEIEMRKSKKRPDESGDSQHGFDFL